MQSLYRTRPASLDDLTIQVAIVRPGPILGGAVNPYIARLIRLREDPDYEIPYEHPSLEPVLRDTLGTIIFQDQVIEVAMAFAGFSPGEAEGLRRAMSRKRSAAAIEAYHERFVEGAERVHGADRETAERVYTMIVGFSGFGFPKAHGAAFGLLAYQSTWLRVHYGPEFLCALLNEQPMGFYASDTLVHEAQRRGIELAAPDVNASEVECTVVPGPDRRPSRVQIGLGYLNGARADEMAALVAARHEGGPFAPSPISGRAPAPAAPHSSCSPGRAPATASASPPAPPPPPMSRPLTPARPPPPTSRPLTPARPPPPTSRPLTPARPPPPMSRPPTPARPPPPTSGRSRWHGRPRLCPGRPRRQRPGTRPLRRGEGGHGGITPRGAARARARSRATAAHRRHGARPRAPRRAVGARRGGARPAAGRGTQLSLPLDLPSAPTLRELSPWEAMVADYATTGLTLGRHPLALLRPTLPAGAVTTRDLETLAHKTRVRMGGLVIARQRPGTAKGIVFLLLEDEFGTDQPHRPAARLRARPSHRPRGAARARRGPAREAPGGGGAINVYVKRLRSLAPARMRRSSRSRARSRRRPRAGTSRPSSPTSGASRPPSRASRPAGGDEDGRQPPGSRVPRLPDQVGLRPQWPSRSSCCSGSCSGLGSSSWP